MRRRLQRDSLQVTLADAFIISTHEAVWDATEIDRELAETTEPSVPVGILSGDASALRAIVRYLRAVEKRPFSEIAALLGRAEQTIRSSFRLAPELPLFDENGLRIPLAAFSEHATLSPLEVVVVSLARKRLRNVDIASLLGLDPRTVWTARERARRKGVVA